MRRRIRLTGRSQLRKSAVKVQLAEVGDSTVVTMVPSDETVFKQFPRDARISLKLVANKRVEVLDFGTVEKPRSSQTLKAKNFDAPTCQLRVADAGSGKAKGILLGSTDPWSLIAPNPEEDGNSKGIIDFLPADTAPLTWELEIRDSDYPLVKVDKRIPNARMWARSDPIFMATAMPVIVRQVFEKILAGDFPEGTAWTEDWMTWANLLAPGLEKPDEDDAPGREDFIRQLLDTFCAKHSLADKVLEIVNKGAVE